MRIRVLNRPGSLGPVMSALESIGADISLVELVEKGHDVEFHEFMLELPADQDVASLVAVCDGVAGVQVEWVRNYPRGGGIERDVALRRRMVADHSHAGEILVTAAPSVFRAQWSLLLDVSAVPEVIVRTPGAPDLDARSAEGFRPFDSIHRSVLMSGWLPGWPSHHAVTAPLEERQLLIVGRLGEPPFFRSELTRLAYLVGGAPVSEPPDEARAQAPANGSHRQPVTVPVYRRPGT